MDILIAWHEVPTKYHAWQFRVFELVKRARKHGLNVTWVSHNAAEEAAESIEILKSQCDLTVIMDKPIHPGSKALHTLRSTLLSPALFRHHMIPTFFYSTKMRDQITSLLQGKKFDLIYCSRVMLPYVLDTDVRKVLEIEDPVLYSSYQSYLKETRLLVKLGWLLRYYHQKLLEVPKFKKFDSCVCISPVHRDLLKPYIGNDVPVIPYGVDTDYFADVLTGEQEYSLVFTGWMGYSFNVAAVCYFCSEILPLIHKRYPQTQLYIVGREPSREVLNLAIDNRVTVTGFVDDMRPFLASASVVIVPMITDDGGFKTKILEAMAMGKPVVSTSLGAKGIDVTHGKDIIMADDPAEFAARVIELLSDPAQRKILSRNGRRFVEQNHSWDTMTAKLARVFQDVVERPAVK